MLLSFSHKFLFVHVWKVAGTSVQETLRPFAHNPTKSFPNRVLRALRRPLGLPTLKSRIFDGHSTARQLRDALPAKIFQRFFKFAFVRNPWDWQVSLYHYACQDPMHLQHKLTKSFRDFPEYLQWRVREDRRLQQEFLVDEQGGLLVDFVGRYEQLEADFRTICQHLGICTALPRLNASRHADYRKYYDARTIRLVADHFREDIERFEYSFDDTCYRSAAA